MEKYRVCMLVHSYYLSDGRVRKEAEALAAEGFSVDVISICRPESYMTQDCSFRKIVNSVRIHEVRVTKQRGEGWRYLFEYGAMLCIGTWKILTMHLKRKFDAVHVHNMPDLLLLVGLLPKWTGAKLILDIHDPMVELYKSKMSGKENVLLLKALAWQERLCCRLADKVISVNETMRENLESKGIPADKIFILNNFPDERVFPVRKDTAPWPRHPNQLTLFFAGTVTDHYDLGIAVQAVAVASRDIPNLVLRIMGSGNKKTEILETARKLGVADRIELCQFGPVEKVREEMQKADVGISSHKAGIFGDLYFSTKILEYMTQGLPVICSRTHTIEKYVPESAVFYFEPGNYEDMARQIVTVSRDHHLVAEKTEAAMRLVPMLSWGSEKKKLVSFYRDLIGDSRGKCEGVNGSGASARTESDNFEGRT